VTSVVITDEHLLALSGEQRAALARRLAALSRGAPARPRRRLWTAVLALGACAAMVPWTVMLAYTLPERYTAHHWSITWVGFDLLLGASFAVTAGAALLGRRRAIWAATLVTATLLTCDAWFDITTASSPSSLMSSILTGAAGNLPLAGLMIYLGYRSLRHSTVADRGRSPRDPPAASR
jgi:hypothetical protein